VKEKLMAKVKKKVMKWYS